MSKWFAMQYQRPTRYWKSWKPCTAVSSPGHIRRAETGTATQEERL